MIESFWRIFKKSSENILWKLPRSEASKAKITRVSTLNSFFFSQSYGLHKRTSKVIHLIKKLTKADVLEKRRFLNDTGEKKSIHMLTLFQLRRIN